MTDEEKQQIETLIEVGAKALQQGKPLAESQQIGATALALIERVRAIQQPEASPVKTTRKKS